MKLSRKFRSWIIASAIFFVNILQSHCAPMEVEFMGMIIPSVSSDAKIIERKLDHKLIGKCDCVYDGPNGLLRKIRFSAREDLVGKDAKVKVHLLTCVAEGMLPPGSGATVTVDYHGLTATNTWGESVSVGESDETIFVDCTSLNIGKRGGDPDVSLPKSFLGIKTSFVEEDTQLFETKMSFFDEFATMKCAYYIEDREFTGKNSATIRVKRLLSYRSRKTMCVSLKSDIDESEVEFEVAKMLEDLKGIGFKNADKKSDVVENKSRNGFGVCADGVRVRWSLADGAQVGRCILSVEMELPTIAYRKSMMEGEGR